MPLAVAHVMVPMLIAAIIHDFTPFGKKHLNRWMVIFVGICGLLPDLDILAFMILSHFGNVPITIVHRTITHSIVTPLLGLGIYFALRYLIKTVNAHKYALLFSIGTFSHMVLDSIVNGKVTPFYPFSTFSYGLNLIHYFIPASATGSTVTYEFALLAALDAILLITWLLYGQLKLRHPGYLHPKN